MRDEESLSGNAKSVVAILECKKFGQFRSYDSKGILYFNNETIELSGKEVKALSIFASTQNAVAERDRLMKEIWEDESVFVINRNVDVWVSKLRKKIKQ